MVQRVVRFLWHPSCFPVFGTFRPRVQVEYRGCFIETADLNLLNKWLKTVTSRRSDLLLYGGSACPPHPLPVLSISFETVDMKGL